MWDKIWKFLTDNKDILDLLLGSGIVLAVLGAIFTFTRWLIKEYRLRRIRTNDNFPFKIIPQNSNVAKEILGGADEDPLADRNIPYQQRIQGRNIRRELEELIEGNRWILIIGRTGLGKTREAVQFAQSLNNEGWTILCLTREAWLDAPAKLPSSVPERKILFFLDDLNKKCFSSKAEVRPNASESLTLPIYEPFQTRLQRTLETFDTFCGKSEIRVIATARNEKNSEFDEPSEWDKLDWTSYVNLWGEFKLFDLPEPDKISEQNFLIDTAEKANIYINPEEVPTLANRNDGTFRNLVENFSAVKTEGLVLSLKDFRDTLNGTWKKRYQRAIGKYPEAKTVYDAIDLIKKIGLGIRFSTVLDVAIIINGGNIFERLRFRQKCLSIIKSLVRSENILYPRDGQIEAKEYKIDPEDYLMKLYSVIGKEYFRSANQSFEALEFYVLPKSYFVSEDLSLLQKIYGAFIQASVILFNVGLAYQEFGLHKHALGLYKKSLKLAKFDLGALFFRKYRMEPWYRLGISYYRTYDYNESINFFRKAIQINPKHANSWNYLGIVYFDLGDYENALKAYKQALELDSMDPITWGNLGILHLTENKIPESLEAFNESIKIDSTYSYSILSLASIYKLIENNIEKEKLINSAALLIESDIEYVQACFHVAKDNNKKALSLLRTALQKQQVSKIWAQKDPNFEIIRDDPLFKEIVGLG